MNARNFSKFLFIIGISVILINVNDVWAKKMDEHSKYKEATFAGGCFWCMEPPFQNENGVIDVVSGYANGSKRDADYKKVSSGKTDHYESVRVIYDPEIVNFERLVEIFWWNIDPTDEYGQFYDRGKQYKTAIFYHNDEQKSIAEKSKNDLQNSGKFKDKIKTEILPYKSFYAAEDYHQDYYMKNADHYKRYKKGSGREDYIKNTWGQEMKEHEKMEKMSGENKKGKLTDLQYHVTQECGTEPPFNNAYWDNHEEGIYVDVVDGTPLFSSTDKYDSGTGWPSFSRPIDEKLLTSRNDLSLYVPRIEVRSQKADSHLGHVFEDGHSETGKRFCINSASLLFIPKKELAAKGYGEYEKLFK